MPGRCDHLMGAGLDRVTPLFRREVKPNYLEARPDEVGDVPAGTGPNLQ